MVSLLILGYEPVQHVTVPNMIGNCNTVVSIFILYNIWYSLLFLSYKPVQHVTVLNTVGSCNTVVSIII